jgi:hypothetical protein
MLPESWTAKCNSQPVRAQGQVIEFYRVRASLVQSTLHKKPRREEEILSLCDRARM